MINLVYQKNFPKLSYIFLIHEGVLHNMSFNLRYMTVLSVKRFWSSEGRKVGHLARLSCQYTQNKLMYQLWSWGISIIWKINIGSYVQLVLVLKKNWINYEQILRAVFSCFDLQDFFLNFQRGNFSLRNKKLLKIKVKEKNNNLFGKYLIWYLNRLLLNFKFQCKY